MRERSWWFVALIAGNFLSACTINPSVKKDTAELLGERQRHGSGTGLALAGGGTKAASYSMGILAALAEGQGPHPDDNMALTKVNAISSVSGGGYAALYLYSKLMMREHDGTASARPDVQDYFNDCMPRSYLPYLSGIPDQAGLRFCSPNMTDNASYRFQQYVRCRQDVLEMDCKPELSTDFSALYTTPTMLGFTALTFAPNFIARSVFDWPVNMSPSRYAYKRGIASTYALYPTTIQAAQRRADIGAICDAEHFLNCDRYDGDAALSTADGMRLGLPELADFLDHSGKPYPVWFINTTASRKRSPLGWALAGQRDFSLYTLQISPYGARSGLYGPIDVVKQGFDLPQSVVAAAAFFDPNETGFAQPNRFGLALLQHFFVADWGIDIPNPNVGQGYRFVHSLLPFPIYYADGSMRLAQGERTDRTRSAYIRLLDGGNNDNLGAFSLLEAGMKTIFVADHAQDDKGKMSDVCMLANEIGLRMPGPDGKTRYKLVIPGLAGFEDHCKQYLKESRAVQQEAPEALAYAAPDNRHYPILEWTHPVLLGCVRLDGQADCRPSAERPMVAKILVLKPSLDLPKMRDLYVDTDPDGPRVKPAACEDRRNGLCEVAAYLADWYAQHPKETEPRPFPQDATTGMTFKSDALRYGAYRELGRWHMREALWLAKLSDDAYGEKAGKQADRPILLIKDEQQ